MLIIYADLLFIANFAANALALLASSRICASPVRAWRLCLAAAAGGAYSVALYIPGLAFLGHPAATLAVGVLLPLIAFGRQEGLLRKTLVFFASAMAFGGVVYAASRVSDGAGFPRLPVLLALLTGAWACVSLVFRKSGGASGRLCELTVRSAGRRIRLVAMTDTGNSLTDPLTGAPAAVVCVSDAEDLFPPEIRASVMELRSKTAPEVLEELGGEAAARRFRLLPYSAVGVSGGMLLAFRPDEVTVDGKRREDMIVALSPNRLSDGGPYSALIGAGR